jgi:TM2 domain-containing membrane protein YozV
MMPYPLRMSENPSQYGPADPTQRFDPAAQPASPATPTSGQPGGTYPYADPTQQMYSSGPGATPTPPTYTTPPTPEYGSTPGYYGSSATPPNYPTSGSATPGYPTSGGATPGYPTSGGATPGYPTSGGTTYGYQQQPQYSQPQYSQDQYQQQQPQYAQAYGQPAGYPAQYGQPQAAYDPQGRPLSDKSKLTAGLLGIFLGWLGVGRFYTGHTGLGVAQLLVSVFTCFAGGLWGFIDGIIILVNGGTDAEGRVLRD